MSWDENFSPSESHIPSKLIENCILANQQPLSADQLSILQILTKYVDLNVVDEKNECKVRFCLFVCFYKNIKYQKRWINFLGKHRGIF